MLDLLLLSKNLLVKQVDLLSWGGVVIVLGLLSRSRGFTANVVKGFLAVGTKLRVFEFPRLERWTCVSHNYQVNGGDGVKGAMMCLNGGTRSSKGASYILTIRRLAILFVVLANFVEVVFVQLTNETGKVAVLEVFG